VGTSRDDARVGLRRPGQKRGDTSRADGLARPARTFLYRLVGGGAAAAVLTLTHTAPDGEDWLAFVALGSAAAFAERLIIPTGRNHGFPISVVFLVAAALVLPPQLVALMGIAQHLPDIVGRRFPWYITAFNTANNTLSALAAWAAAHALMESSIDEDLRWAAAGISASLVLVLLNHATLAVMLRLARQLSVRASGLFAPTALLADLALAGLGVLVAQSWLFNPYLLPLALAPLALIHRSFALLARLGESEERFRTMFEGAPTGTVIVDLDGRIVSSNRAFEVLLGRGKEELAGRPFAELAPVAAGRSEPLDALLSGAQDRLVDQRTFVRQDGSEALGQLAASLVVDAKEEPRFAIVMVEDLTERLHLEEQLRHAQRMEAVGQLAGGVAHDFNNLLTVIAGRTRFAIRSLGDGDGAMRGDLDEIAAAADRAAALTKQLLAYSRRQVLQPRVIDVNGVVANMHRMLLRLIGEDTEIVTDLAPHTVGVRADLSQLEQVILNLAVNARDAMPSGGRLAIRTASVAHVDTIGHAHGEASGPYALLSVEDTGHGIDEEIQSRIFEPFFTTKEPGKGTGLGLSTVYGIVTQSGGFIRVTSAPGAGSTFAVYLPAAREEIVVETAAPSEGALGGSGTLLLAEDDDGVRELAELILSRYGYTVLPARDGEDALRIAAEHAGPIDLLVTDIVMPRMRGTELAERLTNTRPETGVLYMSGYADASALGDVDAAAIVPKPFSEETLAGLVGETLAALRQAHEAADGPNGSQTEGTSERAPARHA
jgi:two-component system, cell cycle sensor histidine kinase and response regulator CckA